MPSRHRQSADDRARARRRARLAARGIETDEELEAAADDEATSGAAPAGGFLTRLFPPAPPLPNRPDPLAGFTYDGPLRDVLASFYLLARSPLAWVGTGAIWSAGRLLTAGTLFGLVASLVSFGSLILAGWIGWQRPWLFGLMASLVGMAFYAGIWALLVATQASGADVPSPALAFLDRIIVETIGFQPLFGIIAGWYGGYLRRRMAAATATARRPSRRR